MTAWALGVLFGHRGEAGSGARFSAALLYSLRFRGVSFETRDESERRKRVLLHLLAAGENGASLLGGTGRLGPPLPAFHNILINRTAGVPQCSRAAQ